MRWFVWSLSEKKNYSAEVIKNFSCIQDLVPKTGLYPFHIRLVYYERRVATCGVLEPKSKRGLLEFDTYCTL